MAAGKAFLVDVGIQGLPFPIKVLSKRSPDGHATIGTFAVRARIMRTFEARWIDRFIQAVHAHRDQLGMVQIRENIKDYIDALQTNSVRIEISYPYFVEKITPVSKEPCLVKYNCRFTGQYPSLDGEVKLTYAIECPVITTYPLVGANGRDKRYFPQLSILSIELDSTENIYTEDIVELADAHSLSPIYSFLSEDDQRHLIERTQTRVQMSVDTTDEVREELAKNPAVSWFSVHCSNLGMLHNYSTIISTEKSMWVPGSYYETDAP